MTAFDEFGLFTGLTGTNSVAVYAFYNCTVLESIILPNTIKTLTQAMFQKCQKLPSITIPASVTKIDQLAFDACYVLKDVVCLNTTPPTLGNSVFRNTSGSLVIYVHDAVVDTYKAESGWSSYASKIKGISERPTT